MTKVSCWHARLCLPCLSFCSAYRLKSPLTLRKWKSTEVGADTAETHACFPEIAADTAETRTDTPEVGGGGAETDAYTSEVMVEATEIVDIIVVIVM
jgi:hypothetical protein